MPQPTETIKIGFETPFPLHARIKIAVGLRQQASGEKFTIQQAVQEAMERWAEDELKKYQKSKN